MHMHMHAHMHVLMRARADLRLEAEAMRARKQSLGAHARLERRRERVAEEVDDRRVAGRDLRQRVGGSAGGPSSGRRSKQRLKAAKRGIKQRLEAAERGTKQQLEVQKHDKEREGRGGRRHSRDRKGVRKHGV
eukprot:364785-Chlamydomonas_euryale.AAC.18